MILTQCDRYNSIQTDKTTATTLAITQTNIDEISLDNSFQKS
jgi:hypothetical protein